MPAILTKPPCLSKDRECFFTEISWRGCLRVDINNNDQDPIGPMTGTTLTLMLYLFNVRKDTVVAVSVLLCSMSYAVRKYNGCHLKYTWYFSTLLPFM